jgi:NAD(P)-dependent dehydrogenase (short-subunit alcohol dehydrogenase family)
MDLHLQGKKALVTGASRGIGLAITQALTDEGVRVAGGALSFQNSTPDGARVYQVSVDLSTPDGPGHLVDQAVKALGGLDILVNNVGAARPRTGGFLSVTNADWMATLTIDFLAAARTTRAALPHLLERDGSTIVSVCSVNAVLPDPLVIDYCAAKAALLNFSKALSKEVGPRGVRVNTVSPGPVADDDQRFWMLRPQLLQEGHRGRGGAVLQASSGPSRRTPRLRPHRTTRRRSRKMPTMTTDSIMNSNQFTTWLITTTGGRWWPPSVKESAIQTKSN